MGDIDRARDYMEDASRAVDDALGFIEDADAEFTELQEQADELNTAVNLLLPPDEYKKFSADREDYIRALRAGEADVVNLAAHPLHVFAQGYMYGLKNRSLYDHANDIKRIINAAENTSDIPGRPTGESTPVV